MSDEELVEQLKEGRVEAFDAIYAKYSSGLLRHLYHLFANQQEAEELLHESMLLMIQKINFYTPNPSLPQSFKAWFYRLTTNRAIDEIRKRKGRIVPGEIEVKSYISGQEDLYFEKEQEHLLSDLVLKLPLMQRIVLSMRVKEDLTYAEISAILGKDINSIKQSLFQARKSMKQLLIAHGEL
jgi:RNA polymerase sigma factor (sigma-70 family)